MNVLTTRVVLRERGMAEVFDLALRFVVARGGRGYLRLWLLACAPALLGCIWLRSLEASWAWVWLAAGGGFVAAQIPFTLAASRLLLGDELSLSDLIRAWLVALPRQLVMHGLAALALGASSLLVVPLPFLLARCLYLPEITLLEGYGMFRAYERGSRFTRQRLQPAFATLLLLALLLLAFVLGGEVTGHAIQVDLLSLPAPQDSLEEGGSWFALFGFFAAVPFLATARFLAYIDGRTRREAWDVQLRFSELSSAAEEAK